MNEILKYFKKNYFAVLQEKDLMNRYADTTAESDQLLKQMDLAKCIMAEVQFNWRSSEFNFEFSTVIIKLYLKVILCEVKYY